MDDGTNSAIVRATGIVVERGSFRAGPVSFSISEGEALALVGPNGSGKSTLLLTTLGLLRRVAGSLEINGRPVSHREPPRGVGALLSWPGFYDWLSGSRNLILACEGNRMAQGRIGPLLDEVGLSAAEHRPVSTYSTGMTKRLELARALLFDPAVLVLDEPTSGLDDGAWEWLADRLEARRSDGCSLLVATHDHEFVERLGARSIRINSGTFEGDLVP